ncbi:T-cell surface glycoprotein CD4 [Trichinella pseudospiralis]
MFNDTEKTIFEQVSNNLPVQTMPFITTMKLAIGIFSVLSNGIVFCFLLAKRHFHSEACLLIALLIVQMLDGLNFLLSGLRYSNMRKWIYMPTVKAWECLLINPDIPLRIFRSLSSSSIIFLVVLDRFIAILKPRLNTKLENHHFIRWCITTSYIICITFTIVVWLDLTMFKYKDQEVMQSCVYKEVVPKFYQRISRYFNLLMVSKANFTSG